MRATVITYINPAVAVVLGVAVLGEKFGPMTAVGFAAVLGGSVLATRSLRPAAPWAAGSEPRAGAGAPAAGGGRALGPAVPLRSVGPAEGRAGPRGAVSPLGCRRRSRARAACGGGRRRRAPVALALRLQPHPPAGRARAADDFERRAGLHVHVDLHLERRAPRRQYRYLGDGRSATSSTSSTPYSAPPAPRPAASPPSRP